MPADAGSPASAATVLAIQADPQAKESLRLARPPTRLDHELVTYDGAPHSFDRRYEEHAEASEDAWRRVLAFIDRYG